MKSDRGSCSQRTFRWPHSPNPGETFEGWATESRQLSVSVRATLGRHSNASDGGFSLPTLKASDSTHSGPNQRGSKGDLGLHAAVVRLPSLIAGDAKDVTYRRDRGQKGLERDALLAVGRKLATLTARDWRSGKASAATLARNSRPLSEQLGGLLHPDFADWYQGLPVGWTRAAPALPLSATRRFQRWLRLHSQSCGTGSKAR